MKDPPPLKQQLTHAPPANCTATLSTRLCLGGRQKALALVQPAVGRTAAGASTLSLTYSPALIAGIVSINGSMAVDYRRADPRTIGTRVVVTLTMRQTGLFLR